MQPVKHLIELIRLVGLMMVVAVIAAYRLHTLTYAVMLFSLTGPSFWNNFWLHQSLEIYFQ